MWCACLFGVSWIPEKPVALLCSHLPLIIICVLALSRQTGVLIESALLLLFCEGICKPLLRNPRPEAACDSGFGMPSSHSALSALWLYRYWASTQGLSLLLLTVPWSRVSLKDHSVLQVSIGIAVGTAAALMFSTFFNVNDAGWIGSRSLQLSFIRTVRWSPSWTC